VELPHKKYAVHYERKLNAYFNKTKNQTEMKLTPLEGEVRRAFVACEKSAVTRRKATTSATVFTPVKWRHNPGQGHVSEFQSTMPVNIVHGNFRWKFLKNFCVLIQYFFASCVAMLLPCEQ
jgi:hypothetical protein